jgi:hypothetical protein
MILGRSSSIAAALLLALPAHADKVALVASHSFSGARPAEVVTVSFDELSRVLPGAGMYNLSIKDSKGRAVAYQVTNYEHDHRGRDYDDLVFTYDFAQGEKTAEFSIEIAESVQQPVASCAYARAVPERYDDFAWENDLIAHRVYGPALNSEAAGRERLRSSGIDIWAKRVPYPIIDRWYAKGHDQFHKDEEGEGLDVYSIGTSRGAGGIGIWDGSKLWTSDNYAGARVLSNGPRRVAFELNYASWSAGDAGKVAERRRVVLDCGSQFNAVESRFEISADASTVGIGITVHPTVEGFAAPKLTAGPDGRWLSNWEEGPHGGLGVAVILDPEAAPSGKATETAAQGGNSNYLLLTKVTSNAPLKYLTGFGWSGAGRFRNQEEWEAHVKLTYEQWRHPLEISLRAMN